MTNQKLTSVTGKVRMNLQHFAQTWNPDNVLVHEMKDGTIPSKYNDLILEEVMENSKVMQLAKYEEMTDKEKKFQYFAEGPGAYWVGEGEKIQTSKAKWLNATMTAKKLAVILPVSREFLTYTMSDFFTEIQPKVAEAFYKKFDAAAILNVDNPFPQSLQESVTAANTVITGPINYDNVIDMQDKLAENNYEANAFLSNRRNRKALRDAAVVVGNTTEMLYDRAANTIDGLPVVDLAAMETGNLFAGDFNKMYYGIPYNMNFKVSEEAQLSTITNEDGTPVNLFEQELMALRITMDVGLMIVKDGAFAKIEPEVVPEG